MTKGYVQIDDRGVNVQGLLDACTRAEQRKSWMAVTLTALFFFSVGVGIALNLPLAYELRVARREITNLKAWFAEERAGKLCWRAMALRNERPRTPGWTLTMERDVPRCVQRMLLEGR